MSHKKSNWKVSTPWSMLQEVKVIYGSHDLNECSYSLHFYSSISTCNLSKSLIWKSSAKGCLMSIGSSMYRLTLQDHQDFDSSRKTMGSSMSTYMNIYLRCENLATSCWNETWSISILSQSPSCLGRHWVLYLATIYPPKASQTLSLATLKKFLPSWNWFIHIYIINT